MFIKCSINWAPIIQDTYFLYQADSIFSEEKESEAFQLWFILKLLMENSLKSSLETVHCLILSNETFDNCFYMWFNGIP